MLLPTIRTKYSSSFFPRSAVLRRVLLFCLSFIIHHSSLDGQHLSWRNYTIDDGLPSNEVYDMIQDRRGFLWFATNLGVCRFNGYEFVRPVDTSAAAMGSTFYLAEDARGRVWFNRLDGSLWIIENDTVRPWQHNALVRDFGRQISGRPSLRFAVADDGAVWIASLRSGFLVVQPDGARQVVPELGRNTFIFTEMGGRALVALENNAQSETEQAALMRAGLSREIIIWRNGQAVSLGRFPMDYPSTSTDVGFCFLRLNTGDYAGANGKNYYVIRDGRLSWYGRKTFYAGGLYRDGDGLLVVVRGAEHRGLLRFRTLADFQNDRFDNLLPGHAAASALRDHEGGLWAATTDAGVFYCKNTELDVFDADAGLPADGALQIASDGRERVFAGLSNLDVAVFTRGERHPVLLPRPPVSEMTALRFDTVAGRLWAGNRLCYLKKNRWVFAQWTNCPTHHNPSFAVKKITVDPAGGRWWAGSFSGFFVIDPRTGTALKVPADSMNARTFSVTVDLEGNRWVATVDGLRLWRDGRYEAPPFTHLALRYQPRQVEVLPPTIGGGLVIALRGGGLLIRRGDGRFTHLTSRDGLGADWFGELKIGPDGAIYACSNAGLSMLRPQPDGSWRIENVTVKHGLPSNLVHDVTLLGDDIWVATDGGIARFRAKPAPAPMPPPQLEHFRVNGRDTTFSQNIRLAHDQNNLALRFFALHFRSGGDIPYRYQLLPNDTVFTYTNNREVNFAQLPPGEYVFEAQAQNEDGQWSEPARFAFDIRPPWWTLAWFRLLLGVILAASLWAFFQNRIQIIRREAAEREKMRELETAALRAQMNPHFIFNCLQAIQSFIAQNEREAAASYLARFAKLVRLSLHGSVDGRHTLTEEIAMLEHYLHLEQLRFRGKFDFAVRIGDDLDPEEIALPPLLVQPFVENALIHGLAGRENGGFVEVVFAKNKGSLHVTVTDNGAGFVEKTSGDGEKSGHKSVGMMLTQKRLGLLGRTAGAGEMGFVRETVLDEEGKPAGTRVRLEVPILG